MARRFTRILGVLALSFMVMPAAQAMQDGWFFEVAAGQANFSDVKINDIEGMSAGFFWREYGADFTTLESSLKQKDRSYALISGYRFNRQLALEVSYIRLGAFQYQGLGQVEESDTTLSVPVTWTFRAKGVGFGVAGTLPIGDRFELRGRAGLTTSDTRLRNRFSVNGQQFPRTSWTASSQDFYVGAGVGVNLGYYYRVGIDWMRHRNVGKGHLTYRANVDNLLLSFNYQY